MGNTTSTVLDNIVQGSNFDREEVDRLRKRFMKLDKVCIPYGLLAFFSIALIGDPFATRRQCR